MYLISSLRALYPAVYIMADRACLINLTRYALDSLLLLLIIILQVQSNTRGWIPLLCAAFWDFGGESHPKIIRRNHPQYVQPVGIMVASPPLPRAKPSPPEVTVELHTVELQLRRYDGTNGTLSTEKVVQSVRVTIVGLGSLLELPPVRDPGCLE